MRVDLDGVADRIRDVAASEILPRFRKLAAADMHEKEPGQLVTIADVEAERRLSTLLTELLPGSLVVGEEGVAANSARLEALKSERPVWIVDPIDGTQNFAEGSPIFATMVALAERGRTKAAWIYDCVSDRMVSTEAGGGVFLNGARLHVAAPVPLTEMVGRVGGRTAQKLVGKIGSAYYDRCVGHEYLRLARGDAHFAVFRRLYPWDHAPGELIVREAGGHAARLDGSPYELTETDATLLLAPDPKSWEALRALIMELAPKP